MTNKKTHPKSKNQQVVHIFLAILCFVSISLISHAENTTPSANFEALHAQLDANISNATFNTAYGLAALDKGLTTEAIAAFERVLALEPANSPVRTELARAYTLLGDNAAAARELQTVADQPHIPADVRHNIQTYTNLLQQGLRGGPRTYRASLQTGIGADSNINTATNSSYVVLPSLAALGPAKLDDSATAQSSLFAETSANLTVRQPLSPAWAAFAGADATHKRAFSSSNYNQITLSAEAGLQHLSPEGRRLTAGISARQFWYGGENYSQTYALTGNWYQPLTARTNLAVYASAAHNHYPTQPDQNGDRFTLGTTLDTRHGNTYGFASAYGGAESTAASVNAHTFIGTMLGAEHMLTQRLSTHAEARYEILDYNGINPTFLTARLDHQLDLSAGLNYAFTQNLSLRPAIRYRYAQSNLATANYTRWQSLLNLRYTLP